eukprot:scaffold29968_cov112-Isochrysis_galbana.AAC.3
MRIHVNVPDGAWQHVLPIRLSIKYSCCCWRKSLHDRVVAHSSKSKLVEGGNMGKRRGDGGWGARRRDIMGDARDVAEYMR